MKESFHLRRFNHEVDKEPLPDQRLPAIWDSDEARKQLDTFFEACHLASLKVMKGFAEALDVCYLTFNFLPSPLLSQSFFA